MGFFYFDESVHRRGSFALGAFVYADNPLYGAVQLALIESGLTPGVDEFKSGARMDLHPEQLRARNAIAGVVAKHCGIGVAVVPFESRCLLGGEALRLLNKILSTTKFRNPMHEVFFDEGVFTSEAAGRAAANDVSFAQRCSFHFQQKSLRVFGLQGTDFVAHYCATMLLEERGIVTKKVRAGENSAYDPELQLPIGFELWATLRRNFFGDPPPPFDTWKSQDDWRVNVKARGLHIADVCDEALRQAAINRFGSMYLGCIH